MQAEKQTTRDNGKKKTKRLLTVRFMPNGAEERAWFLEDINYVATPFTLSVQEKKSRTEYFIPFSALQEIVFTDEEVSS